jgi:hypothetical protein
VIGLYCQLKIEALMSLAFFLFFSYQLPALDMAVRATVIGANYYLYTEAVVSLGCFNF